MAEDWLEVYENCTDRLSNKLRLNEISILTFFQFYFKINRNQLEIVVKATYGLHSNEYFEILHLTVWERSLVTRRFGLHSNSRGADEIKGLPISIDFVIVTRSRYSFLVLYIHDREKDRERNNNLWVFDIFVLPPAMIMQSFLLIRFVRFISFLTLSSIRHFLQIFRMCSISLTSANCGISYPDLITTNQGSSEFTQSARQTYQPHRHNEKENT